MRYEIEGQILTDIADSIREKTGKTELIKAEDMAEEIDGIKGSSDIDLSYLPNSTPADVIASQDASMVKSPKRCMWVNTIMAPNRADNDYIYVIDDAVQKTEHLSCSTMLDDKNTPVTVYCCLKSLSYSSSIQTGLTIWFSDSSGNTPNFYIQAGKLYASVYGSDTYACDIDAFHVVAISLNQTTKKARFFVDGIFNSEKTFNNSGRAFTVGCSYVGSSSQSRIAIKYIGIVNACESDETIIANMQTIMEKCGISA